MDHQTTQGSGLDDSSRAFLLEEFREIWAYLRHLDSTRNKAVVLYLLLLGAMTGSLLASRNELVVAREPLALVQVAPVALGIAVIFATTAATAFLILSIRWRRLTTEYTFALNTVRAAFVFHNQLLDAFTVLPKTRIRARGLGGGNILHLFVALVSALIVGFATVGYVLWFNWPAVSAWITGILLCVAWLAFWYRLYDVQCRDVDRKFCKLEEDLKTKRGAAAGARAS